MVQFTKSSTAAATQDRLFGLDRWQPNWSAGMLFLFGRQLFVVAGVFELFERLVVIERMLARGVNSCVLFGKQLLFFDSLYLHFNRIIDLVIIFLL